MNEAAETVKLTEAGEREAELLVKAFAEKVKKATDEVLSDFFTDATYYVASDAWYNFRNAIIDGLKDYGYLKAERHYDLKAIRAAILKDNREEIIADLNQDNLDKIKELEETITFIQRMRC